MDKYEYKVRADEIRDLIAQGDYASAAEIADTIDWKKVKSVSMLCTISDLYKINRRYEDAKNLLKMAYDRRPGGRAICYSLCELCIKMGLFAEAVIYYKEYLEVAPQDSGRYILQYKIYEAQEVSLEERIEVLEELKQVEYRERWAYELAHLYHRAGMGKRCVEECDELILWFGEGKYVIKAMELKMLHEPLSEEQQERYDHRFDPTVEEEQEAQQAEAQTADKNDEAAVQNAEVEQKEESHGAETAKEEAPAEESTAEAETLTEAADEAEKVTAKEAATETVSEAEESQEPEIFVKTMDVGEYNTINLQAALAEGLRELLDQSPESEKAETPAAEASGETEVFFGETEELKEVSEKEEAADEESAQDAAQEEEPAVKEVKDITAEIVMNEMRLECSEERKAESEEEVAHQEAAAELEETEEAEEEAEEEVAEEAAPEMEASAPEEIAASGVEVVTEVAPTRLPESMARVLKQDTDGQLTMVMPEGEKIEKQITGQISIDEVLLEWERMKKENEEKRKEEVRQRVLEQTGSMFTEFEMSVRDGLLEQLEKGVPMEKLEGYEGFVKWEEDAAEEPVYEEPVYEEPVSEEPVSEEVVAEDAVEEVAEEAVEEVEEEAVEEVEEEAVEEVGEVEENYEEPAEEETQEAAQEELVFDDFTTQEMEIVEAPEEAAEEPSEETTEETAEETTEETTEEVIEKAAEEITEEAVAEESPAEKSPAEEMVETPAEEPTEPAAETEQAEETPAEQPEEQPAKQPEEAPAPAPQKAQEPVRRDRTPVRRLTKEERDLFAPYLRSRASADKLVRAIDAISLASYTGNLIVTGVEGSDTMSLVTNLIREVQMSDSNFSGKVAKTTGVSLNNKNLEQTIERLRNGALIIQKASGMRPETAQRFYEVLQQDNLGIVIALEDSKKAMNKFLESCPDFAKCFTARMDIEALSNDALVSFAKQYAREMEYSIDSLGMLALHTRIEERQTSSHAVTIAEVREIMDAAIRHASRKTPGHFFDILLARRYDDEDMIILTEKDFV